MFDFIFGKKLEDVLNQTKKAKVCGIVFTIRKVNMLDYLAGLEVLKESYATHESVRAKTISAEVKPASQDKVKRHYADILVAGVVYPKLVHKKENDNEILVDDMLPNWELVESLYSEIIAFTYGKKKLRQAASMVKGSSR
jgi:hypothetical protein